MKKLLFITMIASLLTFGAQAEPNMQQYSVANSLPTSVSNTAVALAHLPIHIARGVITVGKGASRVVLETGERVVYTAANGVEYVVHNLGRGIVKIGRAGFKALKWAIKTTARGVVYLVRHGVTAVKWVVTKTVRGVIYIGKLVGQVIEPIAKCVFEGGVLVVSTVLEFPARILEGFVSALDDFFGGILRF